MINATRVIMWELSSAGASIKPLYVSLIWSRRGSSSIHASARVAASRKGPSAPGKPSQPQQPRHLPEHAAPLPTSCKPSSRQSPPLSLSPPAQQQKHIRKPHRGEGKPQGTPVVTSSPASPHTRDPDYNRSNLSQILTLRRNTVETRPQPLTSAVRDGTTPLPAAGSQPSSPQPTTDPLLGLLLQVIRPLDDAGFAYCAVRRTAAWLHGVALPLRSHASSCSSRVNSASSSGSSIADRSHHASSNSLGTGPSATAHQPVIQPSTAAIATPPTTGYSASPAVLTLPAVNEGGSTGCAVSGSATYTVGSRHRVFDAGVEVSELELEVQWDQMQTIHDMFTLWGCSSGPVGLGGQVWMVSPLEELPGGSARFTIGTQPPVPSGTPIPTNTVHAATETSLAAPPGVTPSDIPPPVEKIWPIDDTTLNAQDDLSRNSTGGSNDGSSGSSTHCRQGVVVSGPGTAAAGHPGGMGSRGQLSNERICIYCTYNTCLRARSDRLLIRPRPPAPPDSPLQQSSPNRAEVALGDCTLRSRPGLSLSVLTDSGEGKIHGNTDCQELPQLWSRSLYSVAVEAERCGDMHLVEAVRDALRQLQKELTAANMAAWGRDIAYDAWVVRFGPPAHAAARLLKDPGRCLGPLLPYLSQPSGSPPLFGLRVINLCGSHGHKAVALAALGAKVTVVDASAGNEAYARALAEAAGLTKAVSYIVADVAELRPLPLPTSGPEMESTADCLHKASNHHTLPGMQTDGVLSQGGAVEVELGAGQYDMVLMEMGVLHYFLDLEALMRDVVAQLLRPGGRLLLREFHPISTKLIVSKGKKHKVNGDYFTTQPLAAVDVAFSKYEEVAVATAESEIQGQSDPRREAAGGGDGRGGKGGVRPTAYLRQWALGEVVTAVCSSRRLAIRLLDEEPGPRLDDAGLPKVFTLLAERVGD